MQIVRTLIFDTDIEINNKEKKAELKLFDNSKYEPNSVCVEWTMEEVGKYDYIALYQHERTHDNHYLQIIKV